MFLDLLLVGELEGRRAARHYSAGRAVSKERFPLNDWSNPKVSDKS
jgi:hypothetical protein